MEQHYHNLATLPKSLEILLLVLHGVRSGSGVLLFFFGIGSVIYYDSFTAFYVLVLGLAALFSGITGVLATKFKLLVAHGGCVVTSAVTLYLGLISFTIAIGMTSTLKAQQEVVALLMCDVILIVIDIMISAVALGFQAIVLYISTKAP